MFHFNTPRMRWWITPDIRAELKLNVCVQAKGTNTLSVVSRCLEKLAKDGGPETEETVRDIVSTAYGGQCGFHSRNLCLIPSFHSGI